MVFSGRLPAMGRIQYGDFVFADGYTETISCNIKPQLDAGKRTVTHSIWELSLRSYIDGVPSDANVQAAIATLTKNGLPFRYEGHGCGNLAVNVGGPIDVAWGPLVQGLTLKPHGKLTCEFTWTVSVSVPTCADGVTRFNPLEYSFSLTFGISKEGYTTRNYRARLRIPQNRVPIGTGRGMLDSPDSYREDITPPLPEGFRRTQQSFEIDESKTTLTATITDEEYGPNSLPTYIVDGSASHSYNSLPGKMGRVWHGILEADFLVNRTKSPTWAVQQFLNLLKDRLDTAGKMNAMGLSGSVPAKPLPISFNISEPAIYGQGARGKFSCTYLVSAVQLPEILRSGGLWQPTVKKNGSWKDWYATVTDATGPRGVAGLRFNSNEDKLVDLCAVTVPSYPTSQPLPIAPPPQPIGSGGSFNLGINTALNVLLQAATSSGLFGPQSPFQIPSNQEGWLEVQCSTSIEEDHNTIVANTLPSEPIVNTGALAAAWDILKLAIPAGTLAGSSLFPPASDSNKSSQSSSGDVQTQRRARPVSFLRVRGSALRWGWPIPCPSVVDVNGKPVTNVNRSDMGEGFTSGVAGFAVLPVYWASWNLRYEASAAVQSIGNYPIPQAAL